MRRRLPWTLCLFLTACPLAIPAALARGPLPALSDYAPVGPKCRIKKTLHAHVSSRALEFGKSVECDLLVHSCKSRPTHFPSEPRPTRQAVCADYYRAADGLTGHEICCDKGDPVPQPDGEPNPPPSNAANPEAGGPGGAPEGQPGGATLQADLAVAIQAPHAFRLGDIPFAVTVVNRGPGPAPEVRLLGTSTLGTVNYATTSQGKCSVSGRDFNCELGTMANGESRSVSVQVQVTQEGRARFGADARSSAPDPVRDNNHAEAATEVKKAAKGTWEGAPQQPPAGSSGN